MRALLSNGVVFVFLFEIFLRIHFGLGTPVLYVSDPHYEYIYAPNQDVRRFGNRIITNEFSMRNKTLNSKTKKRILIGDSVVNGGSLTDHDSLASTILSKKVRDNTVVLNISAGSWGPDNMAAYLIKNGHFNADKVVVVCSSHDLSDNMTHQKIVGKYKNYPSRRPCLAIYELIDRYIVGEDYSGQLQIQKGRQVNSGFKTLIDYAKKNDVKLYWYLHPTLREFRSKSYSSQGNQIKKLLLENNYSCMLGIHYMKEEYYRDNIHMNNKGQKKLAEILFPYFYTN